MPGLNNQFMEVLTDAEGRLRIESEGYYLTEREEDGLRVEVGFNPYMEPIISVSGILQLDVIKGGIRLCDDKTSFEDGGLYQKGLHMELDDAYGDRRYWIADTDEEGVQVQYWDPNANTPHPQDGMPGGQFGEYQQVAEEDAEIIKRMISGMIIVAKIAIESQLASS